MSLKGSSKSTSNELLSSFFLNIDGNKTNFDQLLVLLKSINHQFSAIGLAETNIGPDMSSLYCMPGYTAFYQNIRENKLKGTGVALYLHDTLNGVVVNEVSNYICVFTLSQENN